MSTAVILAGGLGTRLRSIVSGLPKPMAPIQGRPFLEYQLDYWINQGINRFVLSVGYRSQIIIDYFGDNYKTSKLDYVIETSPLGTGGGLLLAVDKVKKDTSFLLLNGDTYFTVDLKRLIEYSKINDADCCFSLFRTSEEGRYMGMEIALDGRITSLKSGTGHSDRLVNGGVYWVNPRTLHGGNFAQGDKASLEDDIFPEVLASGKRLFGLEFSGEFIDIGKPEDYLRAPAFLAN